MPTPPQTPASTSGASPVARLAAPPLRPVQVLDAYFLETRAKLLEIAATLDRIDRAAAAHAEDGFSHDDTRLAFIQKALRVLESSTPHRAEQIQRLYSLE
jgi:hypothetical protein